jgi:hypothetical protein
MLQYTVLNLSIIYTEQPGAIQYAKENISTKKTTRKKEPWF